MKLPEQARRLDAALKVAEQWMDVAFSAQSVELTSRAEYVRDHLQEELSRVCFEMEVEERRARYGGGYEEEAQHAAVVDTLLSAYCILRDAPDSYFGSGAPRTRYEVMGRSWWLRTPPTRSSSACKRSQSQRKLRPS